MQRFCGLFGASSNRQRIFTVLRLSDIPTHGLWRVCVCVCVICVILCVHVCMFCCCLVMFLFGICLVMCLFVCIFVPVCLCACLYEMVTLMMPALSGGGGRCHTSAERRRSGTVQILMYARAPQAVQISAPPPITLFRV